LAATSTRREYDTCGGQRVSSYTITITPDDDRLASTTLRVEASATGGRIAELLVRAGSGDGLSARSLPPIDLDLVASALTSTTAHRAQAVTRGADMATAPADEPIATPNLALVRTAKSTGGRASRRTPAKRAGAVGRRRSSAVTEATDGAQRAYRRMPDDLATVYAESGSVTVVARHYGVPRHTAQGWVGRLRSQGTVT
jgi:hypothetical protein